MRISQLIDKQFQMEGIDYDFARMINGGHIIEWEEKGKKKSAYWYEKYFFKNEQSYLKWKEYCLKYVDNNTFIDIDFKYGMSYKYEKGE